MNVVDSSGWLEYFAAGSNAKFFAAAIEDTTALLVPVISLYEVFKRVMLQRDEGFALQAVASMRQGTIVEVSATMALTAAKLSVEFKLPMADSLILATARSYRATLWTQDADFADVPGVRYKARRGS